MSEHTCSHLSWQNFDWHLCGQPATTQVFSMAFTKRADHRLFLCAEHCRPYIKDWEAIWRPLKVPASWHAHRRLWYKTVAAGLRLDAFDGQKRKNRRRLKAHYYRYGKLQKRLLAEQQRLLAEQQRLLARETRALYTADALAAHNARLAIKRRAEQKIAAGYGTPSVILATMYI